MCGFYWCMRVLVKDYHANAYEHWLMSRPMSQLHIFYRYMHCETCITYESNETKAQLFLDHLIGFSPECTRTVMLPSLGNA